MIRDIDASHTLAKDLGMTEFKLSIKYKYGECVESD